MFLLHSEDERESWIAAIKKLQPKGEQRMYIGYGQLRLNFNFSLDSTAVQTPVLSQVELQDLLSRQKVHVSVHATMCVCDGLAEWLNGWCMYPGLNGSGVVPHQMALCGREIYTTPPLHTHLPSVGTVVAPVAVSTLSGTLGVCLAIDFAWAALKVLCFEWGRGCGRMPCDCSLNLPICLCVHVC